MTASVSRFTQTDADSIDVVERARVAVMAAVERVGYPHRGITSRLAVTLRDLVTLHRNSVNVVEARGIAIAIMGVIDDLYMPITPDLEEIVARHESDADRHEQGIQDLRLIHGDSARMKEEHAKALEADAASSLTYARVLRAQARRERETQRAARERFGLPHEVS